MCGISGIFSSREFLRDAVESSIEAISHRGPDEKGFFQSDNCVLGSCRLSICDIKEGQQPNFNSDKSIVSVFNGEIYNFIELRDFLLSKGYPIHSKGDSALIPHLYEELGDGFVSSLQGMFAIAIFDSRKERIVLARDRLGKKPLWFSTDKSGIFFSSELKGLFRLGVEREFNENCIAEFFRYGYINSPRSPFRNIFQLEPASILSFELGNLYTRKYWDVSNVEPISISFQDAVVETERILRNAIKARMVSERPLGAFLSGGIDSSIVTGILQEESKNKIDTFTVGFTDTYLDESKTARNVAQKIGTRHHEIIVKPDSNFLLNDFINVLDQPFADSSVIPTLLLSKFARSEVVVAMSGDGGDETFAGYDRYRAGKYLDTINPLLRMNPTSTLMATRLKNRKVRKLMQNSSFKSLQERYRSFQSLLNETEFESTINPDLLLNFNQDHFDEMWLATSDWEKVRKMQEVDIKSYLPGDLLYKVDMASMFYGLEVRSPFLDYRVVEWGVSLPEKHKVGLLRGKLILRELASKYVDRSVLNLPKKGFGIPLGDWIRGDLKELIWDTILSQKCRTRGWIKNSNVEKLLMRHANGHNFESVIWSIFVLELWATRWLD